MRRRRFIRNRGVIADANRQRPPQAGQRLEFRTDPWTRKFIRPLLISLLATSVALAILAIARIATPETAWMLAIPLCFFVTLEGAYTTAWLNNPDSFGVDRSTYRAAEIFLVLVVARVYSWAVFGGGVPSLDEMEQYLMEPLTLLLVGSFITTAFVALISWWLAVAFSRTFARLDVSPFEVDFYTLSQADQKGKADDRPIQIQREEIYDQFLTTWLSVGMVMIILAALSTFEVDQLVTVTNPFEITRLGLTPAMLLALLIYFVTGFWLLSHARLLRMNARWLIDGVAKDATLERQWQRNALLILLAVALVAAFLPIGSTLAISRILTLLLSGAAYLVSLVGTFFGFLFGSVLLALTGDAEELNEPAAEVLPPPTIEPSTLPPADPNPLVGMVFTSLFWTLLIAFIAAAFLFFLRERGYQINRSAVQTTWRQTTMWLHEVWLWLTGRARSVRREWRARLRAAIPNTTRQTREGGPARPRFPRLGALPPREQVRYYYLALVRRAGERGVHRKESETPLEYAQDLKDAWPESEGELETLTQAFLEARYSPQPVERSAAGSIREVWNRLKSSLRGR